MEFRYELLSLLRYCRTMALRLRLLSACKRTLRCFIRVVSWLPVVFVTVMIVWGYYVYVWVMNLSGTFPKGPPHVSAFISVVLVLFAHVILVLQLSCYLRTIYTRHKHIPEEFHLTDDQLERLDEMIDGQPLLREVVANLPVNTRSRNGGVRYCDTCEAIKPDRCHHCSICDRCVLKMDHHCPWVNNCVGFSNYKFFVLFLFYTVVLSVYFCLTGFYDFIRAWNDTLHHDTADKFNVIFCFFVSAMFGFSTSVLFFFHLYLIAVNKTTIENMQSPFVAGVPFRRVYNIGCKRNLQQVFGRNCLLAFLPVETSEGDGSSFPVHAHISGAGEELASGREDHAHNSAPPPRNFDSGGDDSEVEIFAGDRSSETQPLTQSSSL